VEKRDQKTSAFTDTSIYSRLLIFDLGLNSNIDRTSYIPEQFGVIFFKVERQYTIV
jgi:hypothetical protein